MRLFEFAVLSEGGNAFDGVGTIHQSELKPTLEFLGSNLGIDKVTDRALGSAADGGKKEYMGDIDVAIDDKSPEEVANIMSHAEQVFGSDNVRRISSLISIKCPIQQYNQELNGRPPRTGFVQVDLMPSSLEWAKFYYHSPRASESKFSGAFRNLAIAGIAKFLDSKPSQDLDSFGRPVQEERWMYSPNKGLIRIMRTSKQDKKGNWLKGQNTEYISDPITSPDKIAKVLFPKGGSVSDFNSIESLIDAVKRNFSNPNEVYKEIITSLTNSGMDVSGLPEKI